MYSNRLETPNSIKRSIKDRLGPRNSDPSISIKDTPRSDLKRKHEDNTRFVHRLSGEPKHQRVKTDFPVNPLVKVLQDNNPRSSKKINFRKTEENLIEISRAQQPNAGTSGVSGTKVGSGAEFASVMKPMMKSASTPSTVGQKKQDAPVSNVASFLQRLGLSKYAINFQAEEVDLLALKLMNDNDLKEMGLPMGPRKKILLGLAPTKAKK
ncbi:hypothetical protein AAC387_Pa05g2995 [Persea americana]